jgi:NADH-quinone oxidoreductase subunit M
MFEIPWITLTVLLPLFGAATLAFVPSEHKQAHRFVAMMFLLATFAVSLALPLGFDAANAGIQLTSRYENVDWIGAIGARWHVGVDGFSLWLVLLTTFLGPIVALASVRQVTERVREFYVALLIAQSAMVGAFVALDMLLFYMFWELTLIPLYFIVGIWGGKERINAALKLFLYTMAGSMVLLIAIAWLYAKGGMTGFDLESMKATAVALPFKAQLVLFVGLGLAFFIKLALFPLHTWVPAAYTQAPIGGAILLSSVLLKLGSYGLVRFVVPFVPDAAYFFAPYVGALAVISIGYAALIAWVQTDAKRLVAFSSISHIAFVTLGIFAMTTTSVAGAAFQNLAHGISTAGLFIAIGILQERRGTTEMGEFGGLAAKMPVFATLFVLVTFASAGVPGLVGFVGEFLILSGSAASTTLNFGAGRDFYGLGFGPDLHAFGFTAVASVGVVLGALYLLSMLRRTLWGKLDETKNGQLADLNVRELVCLGAVALACVWMGLRPQPFIAPIETTAAAWVADVEANTAEYRGDVELRTQRVNEYGEWQHVMGNQTPWQVGTELGAGEAHEDGHGH